MCPNPNQVIFLGSVVQNIFKNVKEFWRNSLDTESPRIEEL